MTTSTTRPRDNPPLSRRPSNLCGFAALLAGVAACGRSEPSRVPGVLATVSPLPRAIRVEEKTVVIEGRWYPIGESTVAVPNTVSVTCQRSERRCREDLVTARYGRGLVTETLDYKVREWTKAKLVAVRMAGPDETQIRIYLTGFAAEKAVTSGATSKHEQRWRLE